MTKITKHSFHSTSCQIYTFCFPGLLALTELGFSIDTYYASEIDHDALCVGETRFPGKIKHVGDIEGITDKMVSVLSVTYACLSMKCDHLL